MAKTGNNIPNFITLLNLISGSMAIILAFSGELPLAGMFIFLAGIFDFADGMAARALKARSDIGAQLDSLADVISFGLAPSVIMYHMMVQCHGIPDLVFGGIHLIPLSALFLVAGSAWRLAKFNTDPGQETFFKGLPTPAMGLFVAALPLMIGKPGEVAIYDLLLRNYYVLLPITLFLSWIMVSDIPMISLKFKNLAWKGNESQYILAACLPVLFIIFRFTAIPMIIFLYIIISVINPPKKSAEN